MASTRNINTPGNYSLEQKEYNQFENYTLYANSQYGAAYNTRLPGNGLLPAQVPWNKLSYNAADTESFLFGINSTNLVRNQIVNSTVASNVLNSRTQFHNLPNSTDFYGMTSNYTPMQNNAKFANNQPLYLSQVKIY